MTIVMCIRVHPYKLTRRLTLKIGKSFSTSLHYGFA